MTDVLAPADRAAPPGAGRPAAYGRRATLMAAMAAAAWAAAMGLIVATVVVMASWASSGGTTAASQALRVASATWLLSQHVGVAVGPLPSVHLGLVPLGLMLIPMVLLVRAGQSVARTVGLRGWRDGWLAIGGMAATYAAIAGVVAGMTTSTAVRPAPLQSLLVPYALALGCGTLGALRHDRLGRRLLQRLPRAVADSARAGVQSVALLLVISVAVVVLMLLAHLDLATHLGQSLHAGAIGGGALLVVNAAFLVTAVAWALAYVVGTGFSIGVHTGVSPFAHHLGAVPDLPVLAAVPSGPSPSWAPMLLAIPVLAGVLAGWRLAGRSRRLAWWQVPFTGLGAGVVAGLVVAAITGLSGGPAGNGRLVTVGPSAWHAGLAAAAEIGLAAAVVALFRRLAAPQVLVLAGHARRIIAGGPDEVVLPPDTQQGSARGPIPAPPAPPPYPGS